MKPLTILPVLLTLLIAALFFAVSAGPAVTGQGSQIQANSFTASKGIQPFMSLNTNITWSNYMSNWTNPLTYQSGATIDNTSILPASLSGLYNNPITINPTDIVAPGVLQNNQVGGTYWNNTVWWHNTTNNQLSGGAVTSTSGTTINGQTAMQITLNTSKQAGNYVVLFYYVNLSSMPSNNPNYDYITIIDGISGAPMTGTGITNEIINIPTTGGQSCTKIPVNATTQQIQTGKSTGTTPGNYSYNTINMAYINSLIPSGQSKFNTSGNNPTKFIQIAVQLNVPQSNTPQTYTATVYGLALTSYKMTLGTMLNNTQITTPTGASGRAVHLTSLNPDFKYREIANSGYAVATSQPLQNVTVSQTAISNGSYIEEVQTQGQFSLPNAPDLSYGSANITEQLNVSSSQVMVLDISGLSYLSTISGKNGTINLLSSVNPTSSTSFLEIVEYTSSQWNTISGPPGFFSVAGVEYYFDEIVLGLTALLGIGGLAAHRKAAQLRRVK